MEDEEIKKLKEQHFNNYKNSILENIKNNTNVLVHEDIMSLIRKPPLDSMDLIKSRFLNLAKKNDVVLNTNELNKIFDDYHDYLIKKCDEISRIRNDGLINIVNDFKHETDIDIIKLNKKDFTIINKDIKNILKNAVIDSYNNYIFNNKDKIFIKDIDDNIKNKIIEEVNKYFKKVYQKQLIENVDIKILVKDTTLINSIKEQSERYIYTLNNSHLFN